MIWQSLPTFSELANLWPFWLLAATLGACSIWFRHMDRWTAKIFREKGKADRKHEAHMKASR